MQLKQVVLGIGERRDAAVRAHVTARKMSSPKSLDPLRKGRHIDHVEYDHAATGALGRLRRCAQRKGDLSRLELRPVVTIPKSQRKLQRSLVEGLHEIHVIDDGAEASD